MKCFNAWRETSGGITGYEEKTLLNQVSSYLQMYGSSRFPRYDADAAELVRIPIKSGYTRNTDGKNHYLVESGAFRNELCKGFDQKYPTKVLINRGWLIPGSDRSTQKIRIPALHNKPVGVYVVDSIAIEGDQ